MLFVPFWEQKPFGLGILVGPGHRNAIRGICVICDGLWIGVEVGLIMMLLVILLLALTVGELQFAST